MDQIGFLLGFCASEKVVVGKQELRFNGALRTQGIKGILYAYSFPA